MYNTLPNLVILLSILNVVNVVAKVQKKLVCYYSSWAVYRSGAGKFDIENINPNLCTHLIYAFAGLNEDGTIKVLDQWNDIDLKGYIRFNNIKIKNRNLKTLLAVGGFNEGSVKYSQVASKPKYRQNFVKSALKFMNDYKFDGIDLDWEYPSQRGGKPVDKANYITFLKEMRSAFGNKHLLSVAVGAPAGTVDVSYDVPSLSAIVDFINVMTYDLHGSWDSQTGVNAPLYSSASNDFLTVSSCISYWISQGAVRSKLVLGIPAYGRTFALRSPTQNGVGAASTGPGLPGRFTQEAGFLGYNEVYDFLKTGRWTEKWDDTQKVPYMYKKNQWVSYDNEKSVLVKTKYAMSQGLGGIMVWSIDTDPIRSSDNLANPLLNTIKQNLF